MKILGIWDGHDSGAALIENDRILFAVNEERLTRRKLDVAFPEKSIFACLEHTHTDMKDIREIAVSTWDFAKTLTRVLPSLKEEYYLIRRRKKWDGRSTLLKKAMKYRLTEYPPSAITRYISSFIIRKKLLSIGFSDFRLHLMDHHYCHAASAAFCSGLDDALVVTLDGVGDGLSGSIYKFSASKLQKITELSARHSFGIFFEHVTNLMNMRELEDEGKVMALANYAYPIEDNKNPLMELIDVHDLKITCRYSSPGMLNAMQKILWHYPSEQFAYMAQRTLEVKVTQLIDNALKKTNAQHLCLAGGVFSNVKLNRLLRSLPAVRQCFVFPHMGDGGLALGAALAANFQLNAISRILLPDLFLGPEYSEQNIVNELNVWGLLYEKREFIEKEAARLIAQGEIVFWFQGRMEYGPRALGGRSILARADSNQIKDMLNLRLKKRVWYQPFCPSMLDDDAKEILEDYDGKPNRMMTMAYMTRQDKRKLVEGVINIDGSCRPQMVEVKQFPFSKLLEELKHLSGSGVLLNTSFNLHREPLVCSPRDAIETFIKTGNPYMVIGNFLVRQSRDKI
jgi:carbamoyltransferase